MLLVNHKFYLKSEKKYADFLRIWSEGEPGAAPPCRFSYMKLQSDQKAWTLNILYHIEQLTSWRCNGRLDYGLLALNYYCINRSSFYISICAVSRINAWREYRSTSLLKLYNKLQDEKKIELNKRSDALYLGNGKSDLL